MKLNRSKQSSNREKIDKYFVSLFMSLAHFFPHTPKTILLPTNTKIGINNSLNIVPMNSRLQKRSNGRVGKIQIILNTP